jgi:hypothetical protein
VSAASHVYAFVMPRQPAVPNKPHNTYKGALYDSFMGAVQDVAVRIESYIDT